MNQKRVTGTEIVQKQKREVAITFLGKNPKNFKEAAQYSGLSLSSVYRVWKNHKVGIKKNSPKRGRRPKYLELKLGKNIPISGIKEVEVKNKIKSCIALSLFFLSLLSVLVFTAQYIIFISACKFVF